MSEETKRISRRDWLKTSGALAAGLVVGGAAGYTLKTPETITNTVASTETVTAGATAALPKLKIAGINGESRDDLSWGQLGWDALLRAQQEFGAEIHLTESVFAPADVVRVAEDYANKGYDIIMGNGSHTAEPLHTQGVPPKYPNTAFMWTCSRYSDANAYSFVYKEEESGFMQGIASALITKSGKVGVLIPAPAPCTYSFQNGFMLGARAVNPKVNVEHVLVGNWADPIKAEDLTTAMIQDGVDSIGQYACDCQLGLFQAAEKNAAKGVRIFGTFWDQSSLAPNTLVFSIHFNTYEGLRQVIQDVIARNIDGKLINANFAYGTYWTVPPGTSAPPMGSTNIVPNYQVWNTMSDDFKSKIAYLQSRLRGRVGGYQLLVPRIEQPLEMDELLKTYPPPTLKDIFG